MSLDSWKEEFYPIEADKVSKKNSIEHSILKWTGLRKENLDKHGIVAIMGGYIEELEIRNGLDIDSDSCALCCHYLSDECKRCPITKSRGIKCDSLKDDGTETASPYGHWLWSMDPEPMIQTLLETKKFNERS
jgi:hypothetical protein